MTEINMSQAEADALIAMHKHRVDDTEWIFPQPGGRIIVPLVSEDKRESFTLDVSRVRIVLSKATYQNRARQVILLMRLDLGGAPHRNPDGEKRVCPHLHVYREGFGDKWAMPVPVQTYPKPHDLLATLGAFMHHCNIVEPPPIIEETQGELF
jgi:hypothetical protein